MDHTGLRGAIYDQHSRQIDPSLPEPMRSLVVASALAVDTALKQDSRGFG